MRSSTLALIALCAFGAAEARAEVRVTSCADLPSPVEVTGSVDFTVHLDRDPSEAASAQLELTAFDPDFNAEVSVAIGGVALPALNGLEWGAFNNRSSSYAGAFDKAVLVPGDNTITFSDVNTTSPFAVERLCVTLIDPSPAGTPPARERFCTEDIQGHSPFDGNGDTFVQTPGTSTVSFEIDVAVSPDARVGLDVIAYDSTTNTGPRSVTLSNAGGSLSQSFELAGFATHYLLRTPPEASALLVQGLNDVDVTSDWTGKVWGACLIVEQDPPAVDAGPGPVDAGVPPDDAGAPPGDAGPVDAGTPVDAGNPVDAGGGPPPLDGGAGPRDAGAPPVDAGAEPEPDAGAPPAGDDAGIIAPPDDAGGGSRGDPEDPDLTDPDDVRASLKGDDFSASGGCTNARGGSLWAALALLLLIARRRSPLQRSGSAAARVSASASV